MTLQVTDLRKDYPTRSGAISVLRGLSFDMQRGDALAIMGPSGSGKSTLLHILGTLDMPTSGTVRVEGTEPLALAERDLADFRNRNVGFVFQDHHLLPQCSVLENVLIPTLVGTDGRANAEAWARQLLERVGLSHRLDHRPAELSGGERQRVAVARALVRHPILLLADEPTGNLDRQSARAIGQLLLDLHRQEQTILIVVTHSAELSQLFPRRMEMVDGALQPEGGSAITPRRLLWQSLLYHWRGNVAVFLGVAVATAVLTGALLVGDALRGSLRAQVIEQLCWVDRALVSVRFIREELASGLPAERSAPLILLRGAATRSNQRGETVHRAGRVSILGVNDRFWTSPQPPDSAWQSSEAEVVLNQALADELSASIGDSITLHLQRVSNIPRDTLLGQRDTSEVLDSLDLYIRDIIPNAGQGRFNLRPGMDVPHNAFVPLGTLQAALFPKSRGADKKAVETTRAPLINALLVAGAASDLQQIFNSNLSLDDWGLVLKSPKHANSESRGYLNLESRQLYVGPAIARAAMRAAEQLRLRQAPTLVYLANRISDGKNEIPYSVVVALDPAQPPPLGPFLPAGVHDLKDDEIVLVDWPESPLNVKPGDFVTVTYYEPEQETRLVERTATFRLRGLIPLVDLRDLAPEFPGLTDRLTIKEWKPPFDIDQRRIKDRDERFWSQYRTTPKAFVTLAAGQKLWISRFGAVTSIRLAPEVRTEELTDAAERFTQLLLSNLRPEDHGLAFEDVRARALESSLGSADFGMYFLGFSFFLIVAALLLVSLLSRLNLERRASEIGVLLATGYRRVSVRRLLVSEGILVAAGGSFIGVIGAMAYAWLLLELLRRWWPGQLDRSFLRLHVGVISLIVGYAASLVVTSATIVWAIRALARVSPSSLLSGQTPEAISTPTESRSRWSIWLMATSVVGAAALLGLAYFIHDHMTEALTFFGSGALLLTACLSGVWAWMRRPASAPIDGHGVAALARLGIRNAARHPLRSLLTIGLLGFAVFVIIAVGVFHRSAGAESVGPHSGTGGFALIGETTLPIYQDLNTEQGQDALNIPDPPNGVLQDVQIVNLRLRTGDDTSCTNLYQPTRPQILGVPDAFVQLNRFRFRPPSTDNPWSLLHSDQSEDIPVIVDATTAQYILKKNVGDTIEISDERGEPARLRIAALLADSVLQSQLLVSEANFLRLFPSHEGYQFYLIESPAERTQAVKVLLETSLAERGFSATPTAQRLAAYWEVENTYLATFQALGGLGLLLGALGLAVVLLRTVWERRSELALFRAVGYRRSALNWLLLSENAFLVTCGLVVGMIAACVAVLPHVGRTSGEIHPARLAGFVVAVLAVGLIAGAVATFTSLRAPLVSALRHE